MKFIINTTNLQTGGALQVAMSLLSEWNTMNEKHKFHVLLSPQLATIIEEEKFNSSFLFYRFDNNPTTNIWSTFFFSKKLKKIEQEVKPDAVFSIFGPALWKPNQPHLIGFANGIFLFDDADYIRNHIKTNLLLRIKYYVRRNLLFTQLKKEGSKYWVETEIAQNKLAKKLKIDKEKIAVVGNTYQQYFSTKNTLKSNNNNTFQLLYVSAYYPHKNFEIIPEVINILKERNVNCQFILTLEGHKFIQIFGNKYDTRYLKNLGAIKPSILQKIYEQSDAVFMPSLLETFSANFPEAMIMGKPILCSNLDFAQHICGESAVYFDPKNATDIAEKIQNLMSNTILQKQLVGIGKERLQTMESPSGRAIKLLNILEKLNN